MNYGKFIIVPVTGFFFIIVPVTEHVIMQTRCNENFLLFRALQSSCCFPSSLSLPKPLYKPSRFLMA